MGHRARIGTPPQRANPRLNIPPDRQSNILLLGHLARDIRDLVLRSLVTKAKDSRRGILRVLLLLRQSALRLGDFAREEALFQLVDAVGRFRGRDDGVPDDGFGIWSRGGGFRARGIRGVDVDEELFGVPIEERGEIYLFDVIRVS